jgi:oxygen-independent coproporphyrinogen III oxidase
MNSRGLYVHVPFCKQACSYCDFHFSTGLKRIAPVLEAMRKEVNIKGNLNKSPLHSVYFGGGTPSVLPENELHDILHSIKESFPIQPDAEITLEANPDDISKEKLEFWFSLGFNRLSVGIQTFHAPSLLQMNRAHTAEMAISALELIEAGPFTNFSVDLIYGMPLSDLQSWTEDLKSLERFDIPHISCYALTVEERTALQHAIQSGKCAAPDEEESIAQFQQLRTWAKRNGFRHYEISNFCKPGREAIHNRSYWLGKEFIGVGPSAHERCGDIRSYNVANNALYTKGVAKGEGWFTSERLSSEEQFNEFILTSLRAFIPIQPEKLPLPWGEKETNHLSLCIANLNGNWLDRTESGWLLSEAGMLFADRVAMELFMNT